MKIMGKVLLLALMTGGLTSAILFVMDCPHVQQEVIRQLTGSSGGNVKDGAVKENGVGTDQVTGEPSVETDRQQIVYQTRKGAGETRMIKQEAGSIETVEKDYFSDAVFIGDSRTVGLEQSGLLPDADYFAKVGIGIGGLLNQRFISENGAMYTLEEALRRHSFGKVYLMIGINDMSSGDADWFAEKYRELLDIVQQTQPEAVIYIQGNIPMGYHIQDMSGSLNNENLKRRNEASRKLADSENIFYLKTEEIYADANGHLNTYFSSDGLHIKPEYYSVWVDYLQHHAIV